MNYFNYTYMSVSDTTQNRHKDTVSFALSRTFTFDLAAQCLLAFVDIEI